MTIAEGMIFAAVVLYLLSHAWVKPMSAFSGSRFDNAKPRDPAFYQEPLRARALGAHINGIETFPFFAVAVLLAEFRAQPQAWIDLLAVAFVVVRLAFVAAYLGNWPWTRTAIWNLGFLVNLAIFFMPWWGPQVS